MTYRSTIDTLQQFFKRNNVKKGFYTFHDVPNTIANILKFTGWIDVDMRIHSEKLKEWELHEDLQFTAAYCVYNFTNISEDIAVLASTIFNRIKRMHASKLKHIIFIEEGDKRNELELILKQTGLMDHSDFFIFAVEYLVDDSVGIDATIAYFTVYDITACSLTELVKLAAEEEIM